MHPSGFSTNFNGPAATPLHLTRRGGGGFDGNEARDMPLMTVAYHGAVDATGHPAPPALATLRRKAMGGAR